MPTVAKNKRKADDNTIDNRLTKSVKGKWKAVNAAQTKRLWSPSNDGTVWVSLNRNRRNNVLSPSPDEVEQGLLGSDAPITINIWERENWKKVNVQHVELVQYMDVLLKFVHRWKAVRLWAPWVPPECFEGRLIRPSPLLESIEIGGPVGFDIPRVAEMLSRCWLQPESQSGPLEFSPIRRYKITEPGDGSILSQSRIPFHAPLHCLTALVLDNRMSVVDCLLTLTYTAQLIECAFNNLNGPDAVELSYIMVTHETLRSLKVGNNFDDHVESKPHNMDKLFLNLTARNLTDLTIENDVSFKEDALLAFIQRSQCQLEALELYMLRLTSEGLLQLLQASPYLRVFKIYGDDTVSPQGFSKGVCDALTNKEKLQVSEKRIEYGFLCPVLEMLSINAPAIADLDDGQISLMIESRINLTPLEIVWILAEPDPEKAPLLEPGDTPDPIYPEDWKNFKAIRGNAFRWRSMKELKIDNDEGKIAKNRTTDTMLETWRGKVAIHLYGQEEEDPEDVEELDAPPDELRTSEMQLHDQITIAVEQSCAIPEASRHISHPESLFVPDRSVGPLEERGVGGSERDEESDGQIQPQSLFPVAAADSWSWMRPSGYYPPQHHMEPQETYNGGGCGLSLNPIEVDELFGASDGTDVDAMCVDSGLILGF